MGFARRRTGRDGRPRYTAYYRDCAGRRCRPARSPRSGRRTGRGSGRRRRSPSAKLRIVTPDEFDQFYRELPDDLARLVVELDIDSGMRWGTLTELRVKDFDFANQKRVLTHRRLPDPSMTNVNPVALMLKPALARSGIAVDVKMHGLRHAHASWLLAGAPTCRWSKNASPRQHRHHREAPTHTPRRRRHRYRRPQPHVPPERA